MGKPYGAAWDYAGSRMPGGRDQCQGSQPPAYGSGVQGPQENLQAQLEAESKRADELEDYKVYVKTKEYAEEVAKEKLGLVNPDEILLKPSE